MQLSKKGIALRVLPHLADACGREPPSAFTVQLLPEAILRRSISYATAFLGILTFIR